MLQIQPRQTKTIKARSSIVLKNSSSNSTLQPVDAISLRQPSLLHSDGASKEHKHSCSRPWFYPKNSSNGSTVCECGSRVGYTVQCPTESQPLQVLICNCMTYNKETASFCCWNVLLCLFLCKHILHYSKVGYCHQPK